MMNAQLILSKISEDDPSVVELDFDSIALKEAGYEAIDNEAIKEIAEALKKNTHLKKLNLNGNDIDDVGLETLALALEHHPGLTDLDLRGNTISYKSMQSLAKVLNKNQLKSFYIDYNADDDKELEGIKAIATILKNNPNLSTFGFSIGSKESKLEAKDLKILIEALETNKMLNTLDLSKNRINDDGVKTILAFIKTRPIKHLNLSHNKIGDEGTLLLATALSEMPTLTTLGLKNANITEKGAKAINELLEKNPNLANLDSWFPLGEVKRSEQPKHNEAPEPDPVEPDPIEPPQEPLPEPKKPELPVPVEIQQPQKQVIENLPPQKKLSLLDSIWDWLGQILNKIRKLFTGLFDKSTHQINPPPQNKTEPSKEAPLHIKQNVIPSSEKAPEITENAALEKNKDPKFKK